MTEPDTDGRIAWTPEEALLDAVRAVLDGPAVQG